MRDVRALSALSGFQSTPTPTPEKWGLGWSQPKYMMYLIFSSTLSDTKHYFVNDVWINLCIYKLLTMLSIVINNWFMIINTFF